MASFKIFFDLMVKRTTPWYASQKAVKPDTALADLAALRAYHIDNFLDDKLFDNKHFQRLIDGARRLNPVTKIRVGKPISRDTITKHLRASPHSRHGPWRCLGTF